jgi:DNA polymerase III alpha subunit
VAKAKERDVIKFAGKVTEVVNKKSKNGNRYMRLSIDDGFVTVNGMMIDNKREAKYTNFMESGQKVPKKDDIVVIVGDKADGGTIFLEMIHVIPTRVYMKIRELGKKEEEKSA